MRIDHAIYGCADLDAGVRRFETEFGFRVTEGGDHPEFGTKNAIVSVGEGQFIELLAVADATSRHPMVAVLSGLVSDGDRLVGLCLRPRNLDEVAERLGLAVMPAERHKPDGSVLRWRLAGVEAALGPERLPFFIDWGPGTDELDRTHAENAVTSGFEWIDYGGDEGRLSDWVGAHDLLFVLYPASRARGQWASLHPMERW